MVSPCSPTGRHRRSVSSAIMRVPAPQRVARDRSRTLTSTAIGMAGLAPNRPIVARPGLAGEPRLGALVSTADKCKAADIDLRTASPHIAARIISFPDGVDMDRNQQVKDYLTYYTAFPNPPHFAVMLNGPWGIGKTFLLKEFLKSIAVGGVKYVYVSLYGLTSFDEIEDALFRATYPLLDYKGIQLAGRAAKALGKFLRIELDLGAKDILNKANADVFVFDDLERCNIPVSRVLGYINEFVEHEDRKVIIVANENEIRGDDDYARIREKVIGKTFEIQPALEQALGAFTESVVDKRARDFLGSKSEDISKIYHESQLHNLRVLQQTMWDFERFFLALAENHRENDDAMTALLRLLFPLSFELKAGRLTVDDLNNRQSSILGSLVRPHREGEAASRLATAQQRYPEADLDGTTVSDETLTDLLVKGIVDGEKIRAELDVSSFFVTVADEPAWRTVWYAYQRTEDEFNAALAEMERAFAAREFVVIGEILHVLGLRLWLSGIGVLMKTRVGRAKLRSNCGGQSRLRRATASCEIFE